MGRARHDEIVAHNKLVEAKEVLRQKRGDLSSKRKAFTVLLKVARTAPKTCAAEAHRHVGIHYLHGIKDVVEKDEWAAEQHFMDAITKGGNLDSADANYHLGFIYLDRKPFSVDSTEKAIEYFEKAVKFAELANLAHFIASSKQNIEYARYVLEIEELGARVNGPSPTRRDQMELRMLAAKGYSRAQYHYGKFLHSAGTRYHVDAVKMLTLAIQDKDADAALLLGDIFVELATTAQSVSERATHAKHAAELYMQADSFGHPGASEKAAQLKVLFKSSSPPSTEPVAETEAADSMEPAQDQAGGAAPTPPAGVDFEFSPTDDDASRRAKLKAHWRWLQTLTPSERIAHDNELKAKMVALNETLDAELDSITESSSIRAETEAAEAEMKRLGLSRADCHPIDVWKQPGARPKPTFEFPHR